MSEPVVDLERARLEAELKQLVIKQYQDGREAPRDGIDGRMLRGR